MTVNQIASSIINDIFSGNFIKKDDRNMISVEQLEDEVLAEREAVLKEWYLKNLIQANDMLMSINCIEVDCKDQNRCSCSKDIGNAKNAKHFEIPKLMPGIGSDALVYIGSTDRNVSYKIYYNLDATKYHRYYEKYRKRPSTKPYVYVEKTPNENDMYDCWIFNAPYVKYISVIGVFKDPRQLEQYNCCNSTDYLEMGPLSSEIYKRVLNRKVSLYRAVAPLSAPVV